VVPVQDAPAHRQALAQGRHRPAQVALLGGEEAQQLQDQAAKTSSPRARAFRAR
jgi:hypothetical protein